jgi:hypothetical protein
MTAIEFIKTIPVLPMMLENGKPKKMSNGDIKRLLKQSAIQINGKRPQPNDPISFPVTNCVFFPKSENKRVTFA